MFLSSFDFLSSPPHMYFLQKRTNKTIFGGFLFIIYFLIMLTVTTFYILDFYLNDRYDIRYSLYKNYTNNDEESNKNKELNPHLNFSLEMKKISTNLKVSNLSENFMIIDSNLTFIERNSIINRTPSEMSMFLVYACFSECSLDEKEKTDLTYVLNISYPGYKIDHQNEKVPLEKNSDKYTFYKELYFSFSKSVFYEINWGTIKYKEERGLLGLFDKFSGKKNEFMSIDIDNVEQTATEGTVEITSEDFPEFKFKILAIIQMKNDHNQYIEYIRIKKSLLDVLANIGSLYSSIYSVFYFILSFYSRNYNNYKIVKKLLNSPKINGNKNIKIFRSKSIIFENINKRNKNKNFLYNDEQSIDTSKSVPFKNKRVNIEKKVDIEKEENLDNYDLNGINFMYFLLNNVYCKTKNIKKEFEIINICNNILMKYISVEVILYNQIILESILKDYKWNDICLKNIGNNFLVKKLKSIT